MCGAQPEHRAICVNLLAAFRPRKGGSGCSFTSRVGNQRLGRWGASPAAAGAATPPQGAAGRAEDGARTARDGVTIIAGLPPASGQALAAAVPARASIEPPTTARSARRADPAERGGRRVRCADQRCPRKATGSDQ
jgi:hypothetical protein